MNKYIKLLTFTAVVILFASCEGKYNPTAGPKVTSAYVSEFISSSTSSFSVEESGGSASMTPRISNIASSPVDLELEVVPELLERYNAANNTKFVLLPSDNFNLCVGQEESKDKIKLTLNEGEVGKSVQIKVHSMMKEGVDASAPGAEALPTGNSYAIPVRLSSSSVGKIQKNASEGILFLNRKFTSKVLFSPTGAITMCYKQETNPPGQESIPEDLEYKSWTYSVFFRPKDFKNNYGLVYPNYRHKNESWGYTCFYGPNPTFFTAEGKQNFNQPGYEDYAFKSNVWYHIAGTFEPESETLNRFKFYVNGELAFSVPTKGTTQGWQKIILGNGGFNGWVRDFRLWTRALSQGELKETMWTVDPKAEGLIMYLPLEKDFKNAIPGHEDDWIFQKSKSSTSYNFNESFTFPVELK